MNVSLQNIGDLVAEPSAAFERIKTEPRWGIAFLVFYLFTVLMGWATAPYSTGLIAEGMAQTDMPQQQRQAAETMVGIMTHVGLFLVPLFAALWFVISSAIFKLAARLGNNDALTFRHIYAAVVHLSLLGCVINLVNTALLLVFRDVADVKNAADMNMLPGLHLLFGSLENVKLLMFLSHINPFSVWIIAVSSIAVAVLADVDKTRARIAAVLIWLVGILPDVLFGS